MAVSIIFNVIHVILIHSWIIKNHKLKNLFEIKNNYIYISQALTFSSIYLKNPACSDYYVTLIISLLFFDLT